MAETKKLRIETGFRIGKLTVVAPTDQRKNGYTIWNCMCDCGKESIVGQTLLQSGKTKSCGCNGYPPMEDLRGRVFGRLTVLEQAEWKNGTSYWRCRCECGNKPQYGMLI